MLFFIYFLWPPYAPAQINGGSRNFYTWWTLSVNREVYYLDFFLVLLKLQGGPKSDEIWYFQTPPANFLLSRPNAAEYCNSEKKLVKRRWLLYTCARFGELWPTNP